jgi:hypothetical protein
MTGPFRPIELAGADGSWGAAELANAIATARELEASAIAADVRPSASFADRVLAAVAAEALPRPFAPLGWAARRGRPPALLAALADLWRLAVSGRPLMVRAQALAGVVVLVLAAGSVSGLAVAGVAGMLGQPRVTVPNQPVVAPTVGPSAEDVSPQLPTPSAESAATPEPTETAEPSATPKRITPRPTVHPTATPEDEDDHGGDGGSEDGGSDGGGEPEELSTPHPTDDGS